MPYSPHRSTNPKTFQDIPQTIAAMSKRFAGGSTIPFHSHKRDQLLYAVRGLMHVQTTNEAWVVPSDRAVYIPAGSLHTVTMQGPVDMRTLYITPSDTRSAPRAMAVLAVSGLLRELILTLSEEPVDYDMDGRCGLIAKLIELEMVSAPEQLLNIPLPQDSRLERICTALLECPSDQRSLDAWSEVAGASPRTLARLFERELGMSFRHWRQRVRFHSALEALSNGTPVSFVAHENGYRSASAFSAAFRKVMGASPTIYATANGQNKTGL